MTKKERARQGDKNLFNLCSYLFSNKFHFRYYFDKKKQF